MEAELGKSFVSRLRQIKGFVLGNPASKSLPSV
jgi:hypothetical protein